MRIGVLAIQGGFAEHIVMLNNLGIKTLEVRLPKHLQNLNGLIIPGGESTTIGMLASQYELIEPLQQFGKHHAIWGTCAGAIFLSKDVHRSQPLLNLMDITIIRNAFGSQASSFESDIDVPALCKIDPVLRPYRGVFIRAPLIESLGENVQALAKLNRGYIVAALEGHLLATSFHPELTKDDRFHRLFVKLASRENSSTSCG
jgi:pyridoxal 5'-phosphate synthase pdxT subunit